MDVSSALDVGEIDELLGHMAWVERLALSLVADPEDARDVAQDACALALARPPRERSGRGMRAWLARVTRSLAREAGRSARQRRARERIACEREGGPSAAPGADEVVQRGALQQRVMQAVLRLDEPYRSMVLWRYLDELSAPEIARRVGATPAAVRKRLSRALARLREDLAQELEGEGGLPCLLVLLPAGRGGGSGSAATLAAPASAPLALGGMLLMSPLRVAAAVALVAGGAYLVVPGSPPKTSEPALPDQRTAMAEPPRLTAVDDDRGTGGAAGAAPRRAAEPGLAALTGAPEAGGAVELRARILDAKGWPLAGAELQLLAALGGSSSDGGGWTLDGDSSTGTGPSAADPVLRASADAEGRVSLVLPAGVAPVPGEDDRALIALAAEAEGHGTARWQEALPRDATLLDLGGIRLVPTGALGGVVVDADGAPMARAFVWVTVPSQNPSNARRRHYLGPDDRYARAMLRSDGEGRFLFEELKAGRWRVWAGAPGYAWTSSGLLDVDPDTSHAPLELVLRALPPERCVEGLVLDADGEPASEVYVMRGRTAAPGVEQDFDWAATTDAEGRFVFSVSSAEAMDLRVWDREGRFLPLTQRDVRPGGGALVLRLEEPRAMVVTCRDEGGAPVPDPYVRLQRLGEARSRHFWRERAGPAGVVRAGVLDLPFTAEVGCEGFLPVTGLGPWDRASAPAELAITLRRPSRVHGQVTAGGRPVAGARVQLVRTASPGELHIVSGFESRLDGFGLEGTRTNGDGRYELGVFFDDEFVVFCEAEGLAAAELGPFALDPDHGREVDVALSLGGSIEGRVLAPDGESPAGVSVSAARGDMRLHRTRTDREGRYRLDGLTPGPWIVRAKRKRDVPARGGVLGAVEILQVLESYELPWDCEVAEGQATRFDIDLAKMDVGTVGGRVTLDGEPLVGWRVAAVSTDATWSWEGVLGSGDPGAPRTDRAGAFAFAELPTGEHWIVLESGVGAHLEGRVVVEHEVRRGSAEVTVALASAELELDFASAPGRAALLSHPSPGVTVVQPLAVDALGHARLRTAVAGAAEIVTGGPTKGDDPLAWESVASFAIAPGASAKVGVD